MFSRIRDLFGRLVSRIDVGRRGERAAARYLRRQGLRILARNVRRRRGEIDLVVADGPTMVFVEVKSRTCTADDEITGLEKLDRRKRAALRRTCALYRKRGAERYRLDAVTVEFEAGTRRVRHVRWYPAILDLDGDGP